MFGKIKIFVALAFVFTLIFSANTALADYQRKADNTVNAYHDEALTDRRNGERVDRGDLVTVHQETGNAYRVTYPTPKGYKTRWVPKNIFNGNPPVQNTEFSWPIPGQYRITTAYTYSSGKKHSSRYSYQGRACGIDISAPIGTEVRAVADGTVINKADKGNTSFGKWLEIRHDDGTCTVYAHLSDFSMVNNGQRVSKGQLIARSGNSGNSTGPHLHFEMSNHDTYQYFKNAGVIR